MSNTVPCYKRTPSASRWVVVALSSQPLRVICYTSTNMSCATDKHLCELTTLFLATTLAHAAAALGAATLGKRRSLLNGGGAEDVTLAAAVADAPRFVLEVVTPGDDGLPVHRVYGHRGRAGESTESHGGDEEEGGLEEHVD
jgi:hypothetical protein